MVPLAHDASRVMGLYEQAKKDPKYDPSKLAELELPPATAFYHNQIANLDAGDQKELQTKDPSLPRAESGSASAGAGTPTGARPSDGNSSDNPLRRKSALPGKAAG